ncbi:MAG TPA: hypothetical protein VFT04_05480 [Gemmatimonadales bacterium]|nr:hypothetical protein [Gemmatimonadales bacterium]
MDGRQPHVGASAAPRASVAGILGPGQHAGTLGPERQRVVRAGPACRSSAPTEIREEGVEEIRRERIEEIRAEDREEGGQEVDEEVREEVREETSSQFVGAETCQEEGIGAERGQPQLAEAAGQEARASLKR